MCHNIHFLRYCMDNVVMHSLQAGLKQEQDIFEAIDCEENFSVHELRHAVADLQG